MNVHVYTFYFRNWRICKYRLEGAGLPRGNEEVVSLHFLFLLPSY